MNRLLLWLAVLALGPALWAQDSSLPSPQAFLGYALGDQFTYHHQVLAYADELAQRSDRVQAIPYGQTYEGRPLRLYAISSPANLAELETIRENQLRTVGFLPGPPRGRQRPVVWLSYNIHGNEAASTEAALAVMHFLAAQDTAAWLEELVILLDPCLNPDGRERYVNWYRQVGHQQPQVHPYSREHHEPWPGGRYNHYLFDLNRDWCWQTQVESQQRARLYHDWMPQVHVDFHEMEPEAPYFFGPSARPFHEVVTPWQKEFQERTAENHSRYFDQEGWLYFTGETFDLLYPSYGDTWPTFQGAIGFTYEQGGSGSAGRSLQLDTGDTLSLAERIQHHVVTSLSTIETAYRHRSELMQAYATYFREARHEGAGDYACYLVRGAQTPGRLQAFRTLLDRNRITYGYAPEGAPRYVEAFGYQQGRSQRIRVAPGDLIIPAAQPQARLVQALMEPEAWLEDSLTYDLTAWSLPFAYDLDAFACETSLAFAPEPTGSSAEPVVKGRPYAYLCPWQDLSAPQLLVAAWQAGLRVRQIQAPIQLAGQAYAAGTLVFSRRDNPQPGFDTTLMALAQSLAQPYSPVYTGRTESGPDLGSDEVTPLLPPQVGLIGGPGVSAQGYGEIWHFFERGLGFPLHTLHTDYVHRLDLDQYDVLILPSGQYSQFEADLLAFVQRGGRVIALEKALNTFAKHNQGQAPATQLAQALREGTTQSFHEGPAGRSYGTDTRHEVSFSVPGAIYAIACDTSHPLAYGQDEPGFLLKRNRQAYPLLPQGWNAGTYPEGEPVSGFAGAWVRERMAESLAFGTESLGAGELVYFADSPIIRGFWYSGMLLLSNAVFLKW